MQTTVDSLVGGAPSDGSGCRRCRNRWGSGGWRGIGLLFLTVAMLALLIGRGLPPQREAATATPQAGAGVRAAGSHAAPPAASAVPAGGPPAQKTPPWSKRASWSGSGQPDAAIAVLNQVRAQEPDNADALYLLAMVNFDNRRWADGFAAAQIAVRKNPAFKSDPGSDRGGESSRSSAIAGTTDRRPYCAAWDRASDTLIKTAAQSDPSPKVRERAAELLGGGGRGWPTRSSSSSSSMFKR